MHCSVSLCRGIHFAGQIQIWLQTIAAGGVVALLPQPLGQCLRSAGMHKDEVGGTVVALRQSGAAGFLQSHLRVGIYFSVDGRMRNDGRGFDRSIVVFESQFIDARTFQSLDGAGERETLTTAPLQSTLPFASRSDTPMAASYFFLKPQWPLETPYSSVRFRLRQCCSR